MFAAVEDLGKFKCVKSFVCEDLLKSYLNNPVPLSLSSEGKLDSLVMR